MIPTVNLTALVLDPTTNQPVVGASVTARLTAQETYQGQIIPRDTVSGVTDNAGSCVLPLFPNALGEVLDGQRMHTAYAFVIKNAAGKTLFKTVASLPASDCNLAAIAGNVGAQVNTGASPGSGEQGPEIPSGALPGADFTLRASPYPPSSLKLFVNGLLQQPTVDFTLQFNKIHYLQGGLQAGDKHLCWYNT